MVEPSGPGEGQVGSLALDRYGRVPLKVELGGGLEAQEASHGVRYGRIAGRTFRAGSLLHGRPMEFKGSSRVHGRPDPMSQVSTAPFGARTYFLYCRLFAKTPPKMQNRGALWIFTILLALACLWQLSFSFFTGRVERTAANEATYKVDSVLNVAGNGGLDRDSLFLQYESRYLRQHGSDPIYLGYTTMNARPGDQPGSRPEGRHGGDPRGEHSGADREPGGQQVSRGVPDGHPPTHVAVRRKAPRLHHPVRRGVQQGGPQWQARCHLPFAERRTCSPGRPPTTRWWRPCAGRPAPRSTIPRNIPGPG